MRVLSNQKDLHFPHLESERKEILGVIELIEHKSAKLESYVNCNVFHATNLDRSNRKKGSKDHIKA